MSNNDRSGNDAGSNGGNGQKRWRKRRRRRRGGGGGGGGGGGATAAADFVPEVEGDLEDVSGVLELQKDKSGWLRQKRNMYLADEDGYDDIFVPFSVVRQNRLSE